ncbi:hypothetical protein [Sandaracinus amylolyticus]|nr:hypothetical protein [Sandaracinus amylolyticus]
MEHDKGPTHVVLTCMDYRHMDDLVCALRARIGEDKYDHLILPGAAAALAEVSLQTDFPSWVPAFWSQVQVAKKLHGATIREIWLVDHLECGAYLQALGVDAAKEVDAHLRCLRLAKQAVEEGCRARGIGWTVACKIMQPVVGSDSKKWSLCDLELT